MICTTLNKIREHTPCEDGWRKLLKQLGKIEADDEPLPLLTVLDSNGLDDTLWCLRTVPEHDREWRLFAVWCARKVQYLMTDPRSIDAIAVAERFASGQATREELDATMVAAWDAAKSAAEYAKSVAESVAEYVAESATRAAAWAAARDATWAAARAAAWAAARDATWAAARTAARAAVYAAAWDAARAEQEEELRRIIS